jgi:hypothetical protein
MRIRNSLFTGANSLQEGGNEDQEELKVCTEFQVQKGWGAKPETLRQYIWHLIVFKRGEPIQLSAK